MEKQRVYYVDWLRVLAVLLLIPFHAGRVFNWGEPFYAKSPLVSVPVAYLLGVINVWHMPLLFFLAGASTYFSLGSRSLRQYVGERTLRLLVPLVFGVLVIVPPQTWYGARTNDGYTGSLLDYYASGRAFGPTNLFGRGDYYGGLSPAHLWFILFLFLISLAALPLLLIDRTERGASFIGRVASAIQRPVWWPAVAFVILVSETLPEIGGKNIFYYATFFTLGYFVIRRRDFAEKAESARFPVLAIGAVLTLVMTALFPWSEQLPDPSVLRTLVTYLEDAAAWLMVVALVGFGKRFLDRTSPALTYLAPASYPLYILHQTVIVAIGFYLVQVVPQPAFGWPVLMLLSALATFAAYEVVRRVPALRFPFGMKPERKPAPARASAATP